MGRKQFKAVFAGPMQIREVFTLYRFEHPEHGGGMWYNGDGSYNGDIFKLSEGKAKTFGMEHDEKYSEKGNWISAVKDLNQLLEWFSKKDIKELSAMGYRLYEVKAERIITEDNQILFDKNMWHKKREIGIDYVQRDNNFRYWWIFPR